MSSETATTKRAVAGVLVDVDSLPRATERIVRAAAERRPLAASALAVHGLTLGILDRETRRLLNNLDLVVADGQPVRWALNLLYGVGLDRPVRGTDLSRALLAAAESHGLSIYLYGSRPQVLDELRVRLKRHYPRLRLAGAAPSRFAAADARDLEEIAETIRSSGAALCFVGLGCPRQELFVSAMRDRVGIPMVAVGAAFDYLAGMLAEPPRRLRRLGLEWLWRLALEPRRLWMRYLLLNPVYAAAVAAQALNVWRPRPEREPYTPPTRVDA